MEVTSPPTVVLPHDGRTTSHKSCTTLPTVFFYSLRRVQYRQLCNVGNGGCLVQKHASIHFCRTDIDVCAQASSVLEQCAYYAHCDCCARSKY